MQFEFEVGTAEKTTIRFCYNRLLCMVSIFVNGRRILRDFRLYSRQLVTSWDFIAGNAEQHRIRIEKVRPLYLSGLRSDTYKAYANGRKVMEYKG